MKTTLNKLMGGFFVLCLLALISACSSDSEVSYEQKGYSVDAAEVNQITLSDEDKRVEVANSDDEKVHITYFESDKESYDINVSDEGKLSIKPLIDKSWKDYVGLKIDNEHRLVKIAVPNGTTSKIKIETTNKDIVLSDLRIDGSIEATTHDGEIKVSNVQVSKNVKIKTKNDNIILKEVDAKGNIDAAINNGDVKASNVAVGDTLKLRAKNGDITGTVIGSYDVFEITSEASKGKNNLPEIKEGGKKTLDAATNNGDIDLGFVE